jgi:hypothetical protein
LAAKIFPPGPDAICIGLRILTPFDIGNFIALYGPYTDTVVSSYLVSVALSLPEVHFRKKMKITNPNTTIVIRGRLRFITKCFSINILWQQQE